jgi:hypothetical protein
MSPHDIEVGRTYHDGKGQWRTIILIGNRHKDNGELYYRKENDTAWCPMTLKGFAKWAKGQIGEGTDNA